MILLYMCMLYVCITSNLYMYIDMQNLDKDFELQLDSTNIFSSKWFMEYT